MSLSFTRVILYWLLWVVTNNDAYVTRPWRPTTMVLLMSSREDLSKLTVPKLKERLKEMGMPVSGLKAELLERLMSTKPLAVPPSPSSSAPVSRPSFKADLPAVQIASGIDAGKGDEPDELDELELFMMEGERALNEKGNLAVQQARPAETKKGPFSREPRIDTSDGRASSAVLPDIERLLMARGDARAARDFDKADDIREQLKSQYGVELYDRDGRWQGADGSTGFYPALQKAPKPREIVTTMSKAELQDLVEQRTRARRARNFTLADEIRDKLADAGVELFDAMNTWQTQDGRMDGQQSFDSYQGGRSRPQLIEEDF